MFVLLNFLTYNFLDYFPLTLKQKTVILKKKHCNDKTTLDNDKPITHQHH